MNQLSKEERCLLLRCLVNGNGIRATSRIANVSKTTVTKFFSEFGYLAQDFQQQDLRNLKLNFVQADEVWSYVYCKQKNVPKGMEDEAGNKWIRIAMCPETKLVFSWHVGKREMESANLFMKDIEDRLSKKVQLTTDGYQAYKEAVRNAFGHKVDYAMLVKNFNSGDDSNGNPISALATKRVLIGNPDLDFTSTSMIERQNLTLRTENSRLLRRTNRFSKNLKCHEFSLAIHYMHYNYVRIHQTLRATPAMAAGLTYEPWTLEDLVDFFEDNERLDKWEAVCEQDNEPYSIPCDHPIYAPKCRYIEYL